MFFEAAAGEPILNMSVRTSYRDRLPTYSRSPRQTRTRKLRIRIKNIENMLAHGNVEIATLAAQSLLQRVPYDVRALSLAARCLMARQDPEAALQLYDRILLQEDSDVVWNAKAHCLIALGRPRRASIAFSRATALAGDGKFVAQQAECLLDAGKIAQAHALLEATPPEHATPKHQLVYANTLAQMGRTKDAFEIASTLSTEDQTGQAILLAERCSPQASAFTALCEKVLQTEGSPIHLAVVAKAHPHLISIAQEETLSQIAQSLQSDDHTKAQAHLALFRVYNHRRDSFAALAHLRHFHAYLPKEAYHRSYESALFIKLMQLNFTPLQASKTAVLPLFVTGLPGSGRQAAGRVLMQAADCAPAQPLSIVPAVMARFMRTLRDRADHNVSRQELIQLQAELRDGLLQAANGRDVVVDTNPSNFKWSGLLAAALPEARIIHMQRDQMSTGWALHSGGWAGRDFACQHSLEDIRVYQLRSAKLMHHWESDSSARIMGVSGDALARQSGATARALVDACQLKWSANCELFQAQPDREWHRYAAYLNPLRQENNSISDFSPNQSIGGAFQT